MINPLISEILNFYKEIKGFFKRMKKLIIKIKSTVYSKQY